ncbi:DNA circularization protein [Myxococcus fulvus]|uniref:DNA circularization protein n=1 Tax=Myxococcus fulvus TaxID=33 RepID=UPI0020C0C54B|nr:DNA circularization N-terminal domain-containing protein [Myxococcus fulvus]MCK8501744.1 DNA circularization N-terminal domain-containing protein [Myxococcus fulvus]
MSWRDKMGPASFRGVPFHVSSSDHSGGRRGETHEYPFRETAFREDLGRAVRTYSVDGYVLGPDYMAARDRLRAELETEGPGRLVHPYYGTLLVAVDKFSIRESTSDGGVASFSIDFIETEGKSPTPVARVDAPAQVQETAAAARTAVQTAFLATYKPGPTPFTMSLTRQLTGALVAAEAALSRVRRSVQGGAIQRARLDRLKRDVGALARAPGDIVSSVGELLSGFGTGDTAAVASVYSFAPGVRPPGTTPNRRQEQANYDALRVFLQRSVALRVAELAVDETYGNYTEARAARDLVTGMLDEQAEAVTDDAFPELYQLRADVVRALPPPDEDLPRLRSVTPAATVPSLVLAYELYGAVDLEADIIERNKVRNPCFVLAGRPLEVLSK